MRSDSKGAFRPFSSVANWFKLAWQDLKADFKETKWLRGLGWTLLVGLWMAMIVVLCMSTFLGASDGTQCLPDGTFKMADNKGDRYYYSGYGYNNDYDVWKPKNPFEVTIRSGAYTFGTAKIIDVIWDVVVGRGGQAVLAYISYVVLIQYLTYQMARAPISLPTYRRMFMQPELGLRSSMSLVHDFVRYRALHSWAGMVWIIFSVAFILAFQTITSAMTSYTPSISTYVKNAEGSWVSYDTISPIDYVIHDSERLTGFNSSGDMLVLRYVGGLDLAAIRNCSADYYYPDYDASGKRKCDIRNQTSIYTRKYGFFGEQNVSSTFMGIELDAPTLNIGAYYFDNNTNAYGYNYTDPATGQYPFRLPNINETFSIGEQIVQKSYILQNGGCQPDGKSYQWGFSFLILFILVLMLLIWSLGTYALWLHSYLALKHLGYDKDEVAGEYTAALRFARSLREEFAKTGKDPYELSEAEIRRHLRYTLHGGSIEEPATYQSRTLSMRKVWAVRSRDAWQRHKWWTLAFILISAASIAVLILQRITSESFVIGVTGCITSFGIMVTGGFSRRPRSRLLMTTAFFILGLSISLGVIGVLL